METVKFIYIKVTIGKPEHWSICDTNGRVPMPWFLVGKQLSANLKSHIYKHQTQGFAESYVLTVGAKKKIYIYIYIYIKTRD
jgi:hypothetical protein